MKTIDSDEFKRLCENHRASPRYDDKNTKRNYKYIVAHVDERLKDAFNEARDAILNGRGPLESVLDGDQTNAVLAVLDDAFHKAR